MDADNSPPHPSHPSHPSPIATPSEANTNESSPPASSAGIYDSKPDHKGRIEMPRGASKTAKKAAVARDSQPPTFLTLPRDVLLLIIKEVTHTNDLTALALTNSTLYSLAIPHIYGRFDIVWPESQQQSDDSKQGVDALTFGLATLCHGTSLARRIHMSTRPDHANATDKDHIKLATPNYAQYTRKFSLGNGPNDWVADYMITKESGKMLGTLVAIAVSKMINLETFVWDMPTGVLSDIFISLSSLADQPDNTCKLERVWVRWHDNEPTTTDGPNHGPPFAPVQHAPGSSIITPIGVMLLDSARHPSPAAPISYIDSTVEYPTFSVLPPLKSLSVLDVDELAYLDEMAVLIKRSQGQLRELRVGIAAQTSHRKKDFVEAWDGPRLQQVDHSASWPGASSIGERRLGGVLGVLLGHVYDIRRKTVSKGKETAAGTAPDNVQVQESQHGEQQVSVEGAAQDETDVAGTGGETVAIPTETGAQGATTNGTSGSLNEASTVAPSSISPPETEAAFSPCTPVEAGKKMLPPRDLLNGKLKLTTLELERIPLSIQVCNKALDWTILTSLTLLDCNNHEALWKLLRRQFQPTPATSILGLTTAKNAPLQYHLKLKHIHTDMPSMSLLSFLKETLAPNTLEVLFLHDRSRTNPPPVDVEAIYKGPIRRHRASLRKLLLDSSEKRGATTLDSIRWRNWMLGTEAVNFITSGRMPQLRELSACLGYKDWHTFLQRLPNAPQLRSIHLPQVADHLVPNIEPKELACQILDIITLRPEIRLCYAGIKTKCFEFLEAKRTEAPRSTPNVETPVGGLSSNGINGTTHNDSDEDGDEDTSNDDEAETDEEEDDDNEEGSNEDEINVPVTPTDAGGSNDENNESDDDSDMGEDAINSIKFRLREILFYEDKVGIFKARHARL